MKRSQVEKDCERFLKQKPCHNNRDNLIVAKLTAKHYRNHIAKLLKQCRRMVNASAKFQDKDAWEEGHEKGLQYVLDLHQTF